MNEILHGDCIDLMRRIPDDSAGMILCDLPFGCLNKSNKSAQWDSQVDLDAFWREILRIGREDAAIVLFAQGMFTAKLMLSQPKIWKYNLVWEKGRVSGFLNAKRMPLRSHEDICVFYRKTPVYHPQMLRCDKKEMSHSRGMLLRDPTNRCYGKFRAVATEIRMEKYPRSVLSFHRPHPPIHPTEKSVDLLRWLIRSYTDPGDVVLDPCTGSGSACIAAFKEGRKWIGIEKDDKFFALAEKRMAKVIEKGEQIEFDFRGK